MKRSLFRQNTFIWLGLFGLAFFNGALRELGMKRFIQEPYAHHLSAFTAILIFTAYVFWIWNRTGIRTRRDALLIGLYWFVLTLLTEVLLLNRWMAGLSWEQILKTYNLAQGELWPLVLLSISLLPCFALHRKGPAAA